jgi:hypothetical protein
LTTSQATGQAQAPPREGMFRELLYINAKLRRDLQTVRQFADQVRAGGPTEPVVAGIRDLETNSPLWRLKYGCMYYCRFVHLHHTIEDAALFPMVRKHDPSLNSVVDRLEEDHLTVHHITERIVVVADRVEAEQTPESRAELVAALTELEEHLLAHLAFEENSLGPLLSGWDRWPVE